MDDDVKVSRSSAATGSPTPKDTVKLKHEISNDKSQQEFDVEVLAVGYKKA